MKRIIKPLTIAVHCLLLLSLTCVFSCKKEKDLEDALEKIYFVDPSSASMVITQGQSAQIIYATIPEKAADTAILEWTSDDPTIADVINGLVTGIAPGKTVITAKCGNVTATVDVQVVPVPVTSFSVPKTMNAYMDMPPTLIKLTIEPEKANAASLEWKSNNSEIAEVVIENGKAFINAKKEGVCKISVTPYNKPDELQEIEVSVYPTIFRLMRKTISDESGYVEIPNDDSFDITDIGAPSYDGARYIEMSREDGSTLLESSVEVNNENAGIVSITKRQRVSKVLLIIEEKSEVGATKISVSLKEDDDVYTKSFTITRQMRDFTSETKICRVFTETPVNDVEEMARNATMSVQMFPSVNAFWTSSNESVAKVVPATSDGTGFCPTAQIQTFDEYGSAEITATDESGKNTRKFTVKVSKASFPAGTKICIRVNGKVVPVGESTTIRASYDGRNDEGFGLMDASGNYLTTFTNFNWTIESPSCECRLTRVGASGVIVAPISNAAFSGSKTATLVCTDDAGNTLKHKIIITSPIAFSGVQDLRVTVDGKSYTKDVKVDIGKTATIDITKVSYDSFYDGLQWQYVNALSVYGTMKKSNNNSGNLRSIEFTPNQKVNRYQITVEDEIGQVKEIYINSAAFHFPEGAKIYISYDKSTWNTSNNFLFFNNGSTYFRVGTSATDFVKSGSPVKWSYAKTYPKSNYSSTFRALPSGDASIYALSPTSYPNDYDTDDYTFVAKDAYGTEIESRFKVKKFMNFNDDIWFRLSYYVRGSNGDAVWKGWNYKFESGKDTYVTLPKGAYNYVKMDCCPYEKGNSVYINRAEIFDFKESPYSMSTKKPAFSVEATVKSDEYARITLYDDYGNKKAFYIKNK